MKVYSLQVFVVALQEIPLADVQQNISRFIDSCLENSEFMEKHYQREYKEYCFSGIHIINPENKLKELQVYSFRVRTINEDIKELLVNRLPKHRTIYFQGINCFAKEMLNKNINNLVSIAPVIIKNPEGYWRSFLSLDDFISRITNNCFKKAKHFGLDIDETIPLFSGIEFMNNKPIATKYKNIKLLGDKLKLTIADNEQSKLIAYMLLGTGLAENTSRGFGFVNYVK